MALEKVIKYSIKDAKHFLVGLVGQGPALDSLTQVMSQNDFTAAFPRVKIAGWTPEPGMLDELHLAIPPELRHLPIFADTQAMFAARPGISLVIDLSSDSRHTENLREIAPDNVSIVSSDVLLRFCAAAEDGSLAIGGGENLRKAEKLFALLVEQMDGDILIMDGQGVIIDANRHAAASRGLARSELIGKSCAELDESLRLCFDDEPRCPFHAAVKSGKQEQHTFAQTLENGRVRYVHALCFPVTDALGGPSQFLYIRRDVTEQQQLEQRLQQTEKMAAIGELSTFMAHEIRNPLFSIGGFANALLRNPSLNDLAREKARIIYDESRRLDVILTSILNFARPTEQTLGEFEADTVARQTLDLMTIGSEERGINVVMDFEGHLPKVRGNAENLKQCLINLVKNAMEAMPEGGTLTLRTRRENGYVRIDVVDTGPGIPAHLHDQIFSPFFTTKHGGAGLGLAMTRKVIEEMGGKVGLESRADKGTRISLTLPVALAVADENENGRTNAPDGPGAAPVFPSQGREAAAPAATIKPAHGRHDLSRHNAGAKGPDEDPYA